MGLQITHQMREGIDVVTVVGEVDIYTVARLREAMLELLGAEPRDVVVDITEVPFLDSVGLGVLVGALRRARLAGGVVRLAGPDALAATVLRVTGMVKVFRNYPDVTSALAHPHDLPGPSGPAGVPRLS